VKALMVLLTLALVGCVENKPDRTPQWAVITAVHCQEETGVADCHTAIRYKDGTTGIRQKVYGQPGDSLVAWPCKGASYTWCSHPTDGRP
jgi:hypothetical protein